MEKIKILFKEVGKEPIVKEIDNTLKAKQELVGGLIEVIPYLDNMLLVCNEEGKLMDLKPNVAFDYDYIAGDFFIIGDNYEQADFKSLTDNEIEIAIRDLKNHSYIYKEVV